MLTCHEAKQQLEQIKSLKNDFDLLLEDGLKTSTTESIKGIKHEIRQQLQDIRYKLEDIMYEFKKELNSIEIQIKKAKETMGSSEVLAIDEIYKAFNIKVNPYEIPDIPFSEQELQRAKELGQFLVLRIDKTNEGKPLTMKEMNNILSDKFKEQGNKLLYDIIRCKNEDFFKNQTLELCWSLVSKELVPNTTSKNYEDQAKELIDYTKNEVFKGEKIPDKYKKAIESFESGKDEDKINELLRHTPAELLYDLLIYYQNNNKRLLESMYSWTNIKDSDGDRVYCGRFGSNGLDVYRSSDDNSFSYLGALLSRKSFAK